MEQLTETNEESYELTQYKASKDKLTVLVTGGSGFIGSHTVDSLINNNYNVIVVDKQKSKYANDNAKYYQMDLNDDNFEKVFIENQIDVIVHLAAQASVSVSIKNPIDDAQNNILATLKVIKFSQKYGIKQIIAASTAAVYANPKYLPIDEQHPTNYLSPYAISKHTMEEYLKLSGLNYVICRFSNVYGPRQSADGEAGVVAIFTNKMSKNLPIQIHGDGEQIRDFIYVGDIANAILLIIKSKSKKKIYNISSTTKNSVNDLFNNLKNIIDYKLKPEYTPPREGDINESVLNNKKIINELNYKITTNFKDGLKLTVKEIIN